MTNDTATVEEVPGVTANAESLLRYRFQCFWCSTEVVTNPRSGLRWAERHATKMHRNKQGDAVLIVKKVSSEIRVAIDNASSST